MDLKSLSFSASTSGATSRGVPGGVPPPLNCSRAAAATQAAPCSPWGSVNIEDQVRVPGERDCSGPSHLRRSPLSQSDEDLNSPPNPGPPIPSHPLPTRPTRRRHRGSRGHFTRHRHSLRHRHAARTALGALRVLQLNVNGWRARRTPLEHIISRSDAHIVVLLETKLRPDVRAPIPRGWSLLRQDRANHRVTASNRRQPPCQGGVAILIRHGITHEELRSPLPSQSTVEALGARVNTGIGKLDIWALYRAPVRNSPADGRDAANYIECWPSGNRALICGDVNAHDVAWDPSHPPDQIGRTISTWLDNCRLCCLNDGSPTRFKPSDGLGTSPDLTAAGAAIASRCSWTTLDTIGSDHLPLLISIDDAFAARPSRPDACLNLRRCNWEVYQASVAKSLESFNAETGSLAETSERLHSALLRAARQAAPFGSVRRAKPWWSPACAEAHRATLRAFRRMCSGAPNGATDYSNARQAANQVYQQERRNSWRSFTATLSTRTPVSRVWDTIRSLDGRARQPLPDTPMTFNNKHVHDDTGKANAAATHYAEVSRLHVDRDRVSAARAAVRDQIARGFNRGVESSPFSMIELLAALHARGGKSAGPDGVPPELLRHLPSSGLSALLALINRSWLEGQVPSTWKTAVIVPILKRGKPTTTISSFRPVSLLPCTAKLMERLVLARLQSWQRSIGLVPPEQAGFQPGRSTVDCVAQIAQPAFDGLQSRPASRTLLVAVDLKAAFDRVWRDGLLSRLAEADIPGPWLRWLRSWLADRRARIRWNSTLSRCRIIPAGVPQGSPLSPLLFDIFVAGLPEAIRTASPSTQIIQSADDITLATRSTQPSLAAVPMQTALDALSDWARDNAVEIAAEKTEAVVITSDPGQVNAKCRPPLSIDGKQLAYNAKPKILGVIFDSQLRFGAHAQFANAKLAVRLNILKALTGTSWGANEHTLRSLYVSYARPAVLYAAGVWFPFLARSHVSRLESANYAAARIITGAPSGSNSLATCMQRGGSAASCPVGQALRRLSALARPTLPGWTRPTSPHFDRTSRPPAPTHPGRPKRQLVRLWLIGPLLLASGHPP